jgi:hypothetical protein
VKLQAPPTAAAAGGATAVAVSKEALSTALTAATAQLTLQLRLLPPLPTCVHWVVAALHSACLRGPCPGQLREPPPQAQMAQTLHCPATEQAVVRRSGGRTLRLIWLLLLLLQDEETWPEQMRPCVYR